MKLKHSKQNNSLYGLILSLGLFFTVFTVFLGAGAVAAISSPLTDPPSSIFPPSTGSSARPTTNAVRQPNSNCGKIENQKTRQKCKNDFSACDNGPYTLEHIAACKRQVNANYADDANKPDGDSGGGKKKSDDQIKQDAKQACDGSTNKGRCIAAYIRAYNGQPAHCVGTQTTNKDEDICKKAVKKAKAGAKADAKKKGKGSASAKDGYQCGNLPDDADNVKTKINFGCLGSKGPAGLGPIQDLIFAIIRFLSVGVGIAVTLSLIIAGIQYSTAEGNPESSQKAKLRAQQALIGLIIYIFSWSLLQFLIPGGLFNT